MSLDLAIIDSLYNNFHMQAVVQENRAPLERSLESSDVSTDYIAPPTTTDSSSNCKFWRGNGFKQWGFLK